MGTPRALYGTGYGPLTDLSAMAELSSISPGYDATRNRMRFYNAIPPNDLDGYLLEQIKADDGWLYVDGQSQPFAGNITARDFRIICLGRDYGVIRYPGGPFVRIENGHFEGAKVRDVLLSHGIVEGMLLDRTGADCMGYGGQLEGESLIVNKTLMRRAAHSSIAHPAAHGDLTQAVNPRRSSFTYNTMYYPARNLTYDEGCIGVNNCLRISDNTAEVSDLYYLGNFLLGGNFTVHLSPGSGFMENVLFACNRYAPRDDYLRNEPFYAINGGLDWCNIALFDEYFTDGSPVGFHGASMPPGYSTGDWGVFNWDAERASLKFKQALWTLGAATGRTILDVDGNLNSEFDLGPFGA